MEAIAFAPLLPLPLIVGARGRRAGRHRARALARADRLVAARPRRARAARGARRPLAPPRGPHAGREHRHRGDRRQRLEPHRRPRRPGRRRRSTALQARLDRARPGRTARGPHRARRRPRRGRHPAPDRARRRHRRASRRPDRRRDPASPTARSTTRRRSTSFPGPVQVLLTGSASDWDRRVVVETAPAFAIVGEPVSLVLRVEDLGAAPAGGGFAPLSISLDGTEPLRFDVPLNRSVTLPVTLQRGGVNVLQIATPEVAGELTERNNQAIVSINGVRDRLRVLLVSGEPYPGRAHLAEPAEVRQLGRPRAFHHPAPAGEAGLRAGLRALADRLPDPGAVHGEGRRVRPDHLRPLQAPRHPAEPLLREHRPLRPRRRGAADRLRRGLRRRREPLPLAARARSCRWSRPRG